MQHSTLILLPGMDGTGEFFEPLTKALPTQLNVKVWSYNNDYLGSIQSHARKIKEYLDGQEKEVFLIAESYSGAVVYELLKLGPKNIAGFCFCASFFSPPRYNLMRFFKFLPIMLFIKIPIPELFRKVLVDGKENGLGFSKKFKTISRSLDRDMLYHRVMQIAGLQKRGKIKIPPQYQNLPVLYFHAEKDYFVRADSIKDFTQFKNFKVHKVKNGTHFLFQFSTQETIDVLLEFLYTARV